MNNNNGDDPNIHHEPSDLLPADVLKKLTELLELLHWADNTHHGSNVINIYSSGSQHIDHVDTINFRMDGNGEFHFGMVENVQREKKEVSNEQLARAIENCQKYFWGNSAYAVAFCILRDDLEREITQTGFERMVEDLPYSKGRDYLCPAGTIANAFSDNPIFKTHVSRWEAQGAAPRVLLLLKNLRNELEL